MNENSIKPEVGMGMTKYVGSDRYPYTITRVDPKGKKLWAIQDEARRTDNNGFSESQDWEFSPGKGSEVLFTLRKDGHWHEGTTLNGQIAVPGHRSKYLDPTF